MVSLFVKFQSLGNDFIIFDWLDKKASEIVDYLHNPVWPETVKALCDRHKGVGADCVLIIANQQKINCAQIYVFNADGSYASNCLNGVRSIAHYLHMNRSFSEDMTIAVGATRYHCSVRDVNAELKSAKVKTLIVDYVVQGALTTTINEKTVTGSRVDVGNNHFVIQQDQSNEWLESLGSSLQKAESFPEGVNVECYWPKKENVYAMKVYERGCGITQACSSGAAAVVALLKKQGNLPKNKKVSIEMQGGKISAWEFSKDAIVLEGVSHFVFRGSFL